TQAGTSRNFTITGGIYNYAFRVRAVNTSCGSQPGPWTPWTYFSVTGAISGTFYTDPTPPGVSGGVCADGGGVTRPISFGTAGRMSGTGLRGAFTPSITGSTFTARAPYWNPGNNTLTLNPGIAPNGEPYACSCPNGCQYSGINSPQSGVNFHLMQNDLSNGGWCEVRDGSAYAEQMNNVAISSDVRAFYCTLPV